MTPTPLYVKNCDLPNKPENELALDLCELCSQETPNQVIGAQLFQGIWSIYLRTQRAKDHLGKLKILKINNVVIEIYDVYPTAKNIPDEKIVFRDLPMDFKDRDILDFISGHPGLIPRSGVIPGRLRLLED